MKEFGVPDAERGSVGSERGQRDTLDSLRLCIRDDAPGESLCHDSGSVSAATPFGSLGSSEWLDIVFGVEVVAELERCHWRRPRVCQR